MKGLSVATRAEAAYAAGRLLIDLGKKAAAKAQLTKVAKLNVPADSQSAGYWKESALELAGTLN